MRYSVGRIGWVRRKEHASESLKMYTVNLVTVLRCLMRCSGSGDKFASTLCIGTVLLVWLGRKMRNRRITHKNKEDDPKRPENVRNQGNVTKMQANLVTVLLCLNGVRVRVTDPPACKFGTVLLYFGYVGVVRVREAMNISDKERPEYRREVISRSRSYLV